MSKKILLLTYYFEPCNYVATNRPNSFVKQLAKNGFDVVVVTRHWTGEEDTWEKLIAENRNKVTVDEKDGFIIHRLPYKQTKFRKGGFISKVSTFWNYVLGRIHNDVNYYQFKDYIYKLLLKEHFDFFFVSIPPINGLRLGWEISVKHKIKLIVDVRDFENDVILSKNKSISASRKLTHHLTLLYCKRWLRDAFLLFSVTPPISKFLEQLTGRDVKTIMNGYNEELLYMNEVEHDRFTVTLIGSLYDTPEFDELLNGLKRFFEQESISRFVFFQFIGLGGNVRIEECLRKVIPPMNIEVRPRMTQVLAQREAAKSHVLLVLGFREMKGMIGTKPFEYMGLRKPIIQMPGDRGIMERLIKTCKAGVCPATPEDFVSYLSSYFLEWKENGRIDYNGDINEIKKYSREAQIEKLMAELERID